MIEFESNEQKKCKHGRPVGPDGECERCRIERLNTNVVEPGELTEKDQEILFEAGTILIRKILEDYPHDLPDGILFPGVAARPLIYLVKSSLLRAAESRQVAVPQFLPIDLNIGDDVLQMMRQLDDLYGPDTLDVLKGEKEVTPGSKFENRPIMEQLRRSAESFRVNYLDTDSLIKKIDELRNQNQQKARDILDRLPDHPQIIMIDDFLFYERTAKAIQKAFGIGVPSYILLRSRHYGQRGSDHLFGNDPLLAPAFSAMEDPYPEGFSSPGFDFSHDAREKAIGVERQKHDRGRFTHFGFRKIEDMNPHDVKRLRECMTQIGQKIAEEIFRENN